MSPINKHSQKPKEFRRLIVDLYGNNTKRIELFARHKIKGWDRWGYDAPK